MFYLVAYGFTTVGRLRASSPWCARAARRPRTCRSGPASGAATRSSPAMFSFLLLAFAGHPAHLAASREVRRVRPGRAAGRAAVVLVVIAVLASAITAFVYVRLIVLMYFTDAATDEDDVVARRRRRSPRPSSSPSVRVATVVLGIVPGSLLDIASRLGSSRCDATVGGPREPSAAPRRCSSSRAPPRPAARAARRRAHRRQRAIVATRSTTTTRSSPRPGRTSRLPGASGSGRC